MTEDLTFAESIDRLEGLLAEPALPAKVVGLRRIERLLAEIGNPHLSFRSVLIAGSSGKGSTTAMIASMLHTAGHRTGMFRSPHLWSYRERISLDGTNISEADWAECASRIWPIVTRMVHGTLRDYDLGRPGFFEVLFAIAALYFSRCQVQWAAVEVGLGGRLDATNMLAADVAVVTTVSLEHTQVLGNTVSQIAGEKAAIIKPGTDAVLGLSDEDTQQAVQAQATAVGARLLTVPADVAFHIDAQNAVSTTLRLEAHGRRFSVELPIAGAYQAANAATAVAAVMALERRGVAIGTRAIEAGLRAVHIPGRFELFPGNPPILLDGAHHAGAAQAFRSSFDDAFPNRPFSLLFAAMADKDAAAMAYHLGRGATNVVVTRVPGSPRSGSPNEQAGLFRALGAQVEIIPDAVEAFQRSQSLVPTTGLLVICGSMYLVGLARHLLLESRER